MREQRAWFGLVVAGGVAVARADVSLPALMGDGCVLQRETDAAVHGFASPGEVVRVRASWMDKGAEVPTTTDASGRWSAPVSTRGVGPGPHTIDVRGANTVTIRDVLVGEVWVCSGQSNMEWPLKDSEGGAEAAAGADDQLLRLFTVANTTSLHERLDVAGAWRHAGPESASEFSAVGYHFAKRLRESLGVPVGIVSADWGGTRVEAWMSDAALSGLPGVADELAVQAAARDPLTRPRGDESLDR
jgi:sialate O-acetylesterase